MECLKRQRRERRNTWCSCCVLGGGRESRPSKMTQTVESEAQERRAAYFFERKKRMPRVCRRKFPQLCRENISLFAACGKWTTPTARRTTSAASVAAAAARMNSRQQRRERVRDHRGGGVTTAIQTKVGEKLLFLPAPQSEEKVSVDTHVYAERRSAARESSPGEKKSHWQRALHAAACE